MRKLSLLSAAFICTFGHTSAWALNVQIQLDQRAQQLLGSQLSLAEDQLEAQINRQAQSLVGDLNVSDFLQQSANAQALVGRGLGADYASLPDGFMLGVGVGVAAIAGDATLNVLQQASSGDLESAVPVGAGAQLSLMLGYNFAKQGLPQLTVFAHGGGAPISFSEFEGNFYNFGANVQYRPFRQYGSKVFSWDGLAVTSGFAVSRMKLQLTQADSIDFSTTINGIGIQSASSGGVNLIQKSFSVPLELTTSVSMLYFLTLYGGMGVDFNFGAAELAIDASTTISAGSNASAGSVQATLDDSGRADRASFRVLGGLQANMGPFKLYTQTNYLPQNQALSVTAGARMTF